MIEGEKVRLRGFEKEDAEELHEAMNNPDMIRFLSVYKPHSKEEEEEWIEKTWEERKKGEKYAFAIEEKENGELIGSISLMDIEDNNKRAEIGAWIKQEYWGKGYGTEAEKLIIKYGFEELNLHSIYGRVYEFNKRSQRAVEKTGFKKAGRFREAIYRHGEYHDAILYDILKEEYMENKEEI